MSERAQPFHCPYCGEQDLWPHEAAAESRAGGWECRACLRAFSVTMLGMIPRPGGVS